MVRVLSEKEECLSDRLRNVITLLGDSNNWVFAIKECFTSFELLSNLCIYAFEICGG